MVTSKSNGVNLRAGSWNDDGKDKKTKNIIRKNIVGSCGTTLPEALRRKRLCSINRDGIAQDFYDNVKRPRMVEEYFSGAQCIDVHNHMRPGSLGLEKRPTNRWKWHFLQTFLGIVETDAFIAYTRFCPMKYRVSHRKFLMQFIGKLLNNKYGLAKSAPVLRCRNVKIMMS